MDEIKNKRSDIKLNKFDNAPHMNLTDSEQNILNHIKYCSPNLSISMISVLSEMFGYSVGCKRKITELEKRVIELEERLNSENSDWYDNKKCALLNTFLFLCLLYNSDKPAL